MKRINPENNLAKVPRYLLFGVLILIAIALLAKSFYIVESGYTGVLFTFGDAKLEPMTEGLHFKVPFMQTVTMMETRTLKYEASATAASKDLQVVTTYLAVNYKLQRDLAPTIYRDLGLTYEERIIQPAVQETVKAVTAQFKAEDLVVKRQDVKRLVTDQLAEKLKGRGLIIEEISMTEFDFSAQFNAAIESKVTAEQEALKAENELARIKIEKEQKITRAQADAEALKEDARARAFAREADANASAYARRVQADAEAYAQKELADAEAYMLDQVAREIEQNPELIDYLSVEKWNGGVPKVTSGGNVPFLDVNALANE